MPCVRIPGGLACTGGGRYAAPCQEPGCTSPHVALCDAPVVRDGVAATCDRRMCPSHRHRVGANRDLCGAHWRQQSKATR